MNKPAARILLILCQMALTACFQVAFGQPKGQASLLTSSNHQQGAFPLIKSNKVPAIYVDHSDAKVVSIASHALAADLQLVSDIKPDVISTFNGNHDLLILAGTIGQSAAIDKLIQSKKLDVSKIMGAWETFTIAIIEAPIQGLKQALVVAGSDPRGTAFGIFELSRSAGVSPWVWWADALPAKQKNLSVLPGTVISKGPSVKYRGIFLNDEDWGLQPWAAKTFEPETGDIGPKTYAKIFELLLRLRGNLIWPAMHECTRSFFTIAGNAKVAEDYAIIIGSSHAEPMLRSNTGEWNSKVKGSFNYVTNKDSVYKYWEDRVVESKGINAMYSMGMRGVHDSKMEGVKDAKEAVPLLHAIFNDQRKMLGQHINKDVTKVPQVFTAYKEVLEIYDNGLKLPDDITLVWPDDNYGYIQRLNNEEEKKRPGGSGVYYHASYWGRPHDYLWLSTTHPALIQEEMMKAYKNGSNQLWVLNAGDIKPLEYNIEMFMDMAYNASPFKNNQYARQHLRQWSASLFGKDRAEKVQSALWEYYQLAFERRPEFMGWSQTEPTTKTNHTAFNHFHFGDEAQKRIDRYQALEEKVKELRAKILPKDDAAFYQMVYYPVVGASLMNKKFLFRDKSHLYAKQNRLSALDYALQSKSVYDSIAIETEYFNNQMSGGKWKNIMSMAPRNLPVFHEPDLQPMNITGSEAWDVAPEAWISRDSILLPGSGMRALPAFDNLNRQQYFADIFLTENQSLDWNATAPGWIKLSIQKGRLTTDFGKKQSRIYITADWKKAPKQASFKGLIQFEGGGKKIAVEVSGKTLSVPANYKGFIENNGYVSMRASHFSRLKQQTHGQWTLLPGLGYSGDAIQSQNVSLQNIEKAKDLGWIKAHASYAEYDFYTFNKASAAITIFGLPTHPMNNHYSLRYAVSVDDGPLQIVDFKTIGRSEEWKQNVLRNRAEKKLQLPTLEQGLHRLRIYCIDPNVVLQDLVIDLGGLKNAYSAIPETKAVTGY